MPVMVETYANVEYEVYNACRDILGLNMSVSCGLLANAKRESSFRPTAGGDNGTSYGLFQWHKGRKQNLINYCNSNNMSYSSVAGQMQYLKHELETGYSKVYTTLKDLSSQGDSKQVAYDAAYRFCLDFEKPAGGKTSADDRGKLAQEYYDKYRQDAGSSSGASYAGSYSDVTGESLSSNIPAVGEAIGYSAIQLSNRYTPIVQSNLSTAEADGFDYGYLIDMDHGGTFKFYLPEFSESAGAQWETINIPGRSADIYSYKSTSSRSISISLDLYAGEGLYKTAGESFEDAVTRMHKDANFVKALEYPDYSNSVVAPPPRVHLILGSAVNIEGVVEGVTVEHKKPVDTQNRAIYLKVSFTVKQVADNPLDYNDILGGTGSIRSADNPSSMTDNTTSSVMPNNDAPKASSVNDNIVDSDDATET